MQQPSEFKMHPPWRAGVLHWAQFEPAALQLTQQRVNAVNQPLLHTFRYAVLYLCCCAVLIFHYTGRGAPLCAAAAANQHGKQQQLSGPQVHIAALHAPLGTSTAQRLTQAGKVHRQYNCPLRCSETNESTGIKNNQAKQENRLCNPRDPLSTVTSAP